MTTAVFLPAGVVQKQMWVVDRMDPAAGIYNEDVAFWIDGDLRVDALESAWRTLADRHEVLRYVFDTKDGDLRIRVEPASDLSLLTAECATEDEALAWGTDLVQRVYDITTTPPVRLGLARVAGSGRQLLVIGFHHAVIDAGSLGLVFEELSEAYAAGLAGREPDLPPVERTYADFVALTETDEHRRMVDKYLPKVVERLTENGGARSAELPEDRPRGPLKSTHGQLTEAAFPPGIVQRLRVFAAEHRVTPFHILLAGMTALLRRYTRLDEMILGVGSGGRPEGFEESVGPFACFVPVRMSTGNEICFVDLLEQARRTTFEMAHSQYVPFSRVVNEVVTTRDPSRSPLVQIVFNAPPLSFRSDVLEGCSLQPARLPRTRARIDLLVNLEWHGLDITGTSEFDDSLYDKDTITGFLGQLGLLIDEALQQPKLPVDELPVPGIPERVLSGLVDRNAERVAVVSKDSRVRRHLVEACRELLENHGVVPDDDFFAAGGHSMLAARLVQRLSEEFGVDVPLLMVFEHPVLSELATEIDAQFPEVEQILERFESLSSSELDALLEDDDPAFSDPASVTSLSGHEQPFWLMEQFAPGSSVNTLTLRMTGSGPLDVEALERALNRVIDREEILRTSYGADENMNSVRFVHDHAPTRVAVHRGDALDLARRESTTGFDISAAPLLRCSVALLDDERFEIVLAIHHLIMDYWGVTKVMLPALSAFYREELTGVPASLDPPQGYREAIVRDEAWRTSAQARAELDYWRGQLQGMQPAELPTDRPRLDAVDFAGAAVVASVESDVLRRLEERLTAQGTTLFVAVAAAVAVAARRWSGTDDISFMSPAENRRTEADTRVMGTFVNLVTLRFRFTPDLTWEELLAQGRRIASEAYAGQSVPISEALAAVGQQNVIASGQGRYLVLNVFSDRTGLDLSGCRIDGGAIIPHESASTDLELSVLNTSSGRLELTMKYRSSLWEASTIERFLGDVVDALRQVSIDSLNSTVR